MSHELDFSKGFAAIATGVGTETPWHGYVNEYLTDDDTPESACVKGGINFTVKKSPPIGYPVTLDDGTQTHMEYENKCVVYRADNGAALSTMSVNSYVPAQPVDLVRGLFEVTKNSGFKLDCIMALKGGKVISALARRETDPGAIGDDVTLPYLALLTSYDGTFARQGSLTAVRRVCMNTVRFSLQNEQTKTVRMRNSREFTIESANDLFDKLGEFDAAFARYMDQSRAMAKVKMTDNRLERFFAKLYAPEALLRDDWQKCPMDYDKVSTNAKNVIADLLNFARDCPGANLPSSDGTLYGAFNAVTYFQDHEARTKGNKRWESAFIGNGANKKEEALELALTLI